MKTTGDIAAVIGVSRQRIYNIISKMPENEKETYKISKTKNGYIVEWTKETEQYFEKRCCGVPYGYKKGKF